MMRNLSFNETDFAKKLEFYGIPDTQNHVRNRSRDQRFPHMVLVQGDNYWRDEITQWCWDKFGPMQIEGDDGCPYEWCPHSDVDSDCFGESIIREIHNAWHGKTHNLGEVLSGEWGNTLMDVSRTWFAKACNDDADLMARILVQPHSERNKQNDTRFYLDQCNHEEFIKLLISLPEKLMDDFIYDSIVWDYPAGVWQYEHCHKGTWKTIYRKKTGYDYCFEDFCFQNLGDATYFRLTHI